jgi:hypothetical protein
MIYLILPALIATIGLNDAEDANKAFIAQNWTQAATLYEQVAKASPENGQAGYRLGISKQNLSDYKGSKIAFERAEKLQFAPIMTTFNLADVTIRLGDQKEALKWLNLSLERGLAPGRLVRSTESLKPLLSDKEVSVRLALLDNPTESLPGAKGFDFWIGEWNVYSAGIKVGHNKISKEMLGFAVIEQWTDRQLNRGQSTFYFVASAGEWRQVWVDEGGTVVEKAGKPSENSITLIGKSTRRDGTVVMNRETLSRIGPDSVSQVIEISTDEGKTWGQRMELRYERIKP